MGQSIHFTIKRNNKTVNELNFDSTPIYIGRKTGIQVVLPNMAISREHAMIVLKEGKWILEDLDSANKTYLNCEPIRKARIKSGDIIQIADYVLEVHFQDSADKETKRPSTSEDTAALDQTDSSEIAEAATLSTPRDEVVVRKPDGAHAPAMRLAARRLTDFSQAVEILGNVKDLDELVRTLIDTSLQQFTAFRVWCGLRSQKTGPITYQLGKRRDGKPIGLKDIKQSDRITQTFERGQSLVLPQVSAEIEAAERIRSAMIASIKTSKGCFGVIYIDNAMVHEHYSLSDLDYLMILATHSAAVLKHFL